MASSCSMANYYTRHQEDISSNTVSMPEGFSDHIKEMTTCKDLGCEVIIIDEHEKNLEKKVLTLTTINLRKICLSSLILRSLIFRCLPI